ncbi:MULTISPECIES: tyrosine-type recombinase/integrase [Kocuria]|uniref:tyrosine-type recombinase/integrase n=1 Tax=Kocuria TaxID=57493 RepID=UPI000BF133E7|nr:MULTISPECIES: tyrosine-type recombinase/integrase [Kocuria]MDT0119054.1 tyrosine-type recombinase/integrase [Kocuria sp. PD6]QBJ22469.1 site-specific integrase [Kocuria indica]
MVKVEVPQGAASLVLAPGVTFLQEEESVFEAMVQGWSAQMIGGRGLQRRSVAAVVSTVRRFQASTSEWPWRWSPQLFDEWMTDRVRTRALAPTTIRSYQYAVRSFCTYLCSEHYGWVAECEERFGGHPSQIYHEENTAQHLQGYEGRPGRRPLSRDELQKLFDQADAEVAARLDAGRKGAVIAYRDATLLKVVYGWGLRANEAAHLDVTDFYRNPHAAQFGDYGVLQVRFGKASRGGAPKRRSVVSLFDWAVEAVVDYIANVRPLVVKSASSAASNALWLTERGTRLQARDVADRFGFYRDELGLDPALSPHCLRHSYVTHLIEDGVDPRFVQEQAGHVYQSTTGLYTAVSGDFKNKMLHDAIRAVLPTNPGGQRQ